MEENKITVHYMNGSIGLYDNVYKYMISNNFIYFVDKQNKITRLINFDNVTSIVFDGAFEEVQDNA